MSRYKCIKLDRKLGYFLLKLIDIVKILRPRVLRLLPALKLLFQDLLLIFRGAKYTHFQYVDP